MVRLRPMRLGDVDALRSWDEDEDVVAALGGPGAEWYDWPTELARHVAWRELLIAEEDGRPIGFVQLVDARDEESHYWGDVPAGTWALDIWIGSPQDRGRGLGGRMMGEAIDRIFDRHGATEVLIDPKVTNERAIAFYRKLGFEEVGVRRFGDDECLVMRLVRPA
ncbi:MAG: GNAT family N-acetyltransferase [Actinomycetota bacterium]